VALVVALTVLYRLTELELSELAARRTVLYLAVFPTPSSSTRRTPSRCSSRWSSAASTPRAGRPGCSPAVSARSRR
jgi:hypothetical protein